MFKIKTILLVSVKGVILSFMLLNGCGDVEDVVDYVSDGTYEGGWCSCCTYDSDCDGDMYLCNI